MEPESLANGSQEEKNVLKPTKSILSSGEPTIIENGNDDNEISKNTENGHSEEGTNENTVCTNTEKENSVKNEPFPSKRDLRPRESTPRSTPVKEKAPKAGTPKRETKVKASNKTPDEKPIDSITEEKPDTTVENSDTTVENSDTNVEKSEKMIESPEAKLDNLNDLRETCLESNEELSEENVVVDVITEEQKQYSAVGFFSSFLSPKKSANPENIGEVATSQCVLNIESPSLAETYDMKTDIQSRRAIKAFSRFPGRNVSLSPSLKRKGEDDPIHHDEKKKCTRESGSEKSPGWRFLPSPFTLWSPNKKFDTSVPTSTPLKKINDDDSMAVNFNENSHQSLENSTQIITEGPAKPKEVRSKCLIMSQNVCNEGVTLIYRRSYPGE